MKKRVILLGGIVLAGLIAGFGFFWPFSRKPTYLRVPGIIEIQEARLGSKVGGRVKAIARKEGRPLEGVPVEPYRELVIFEAPDLEAQYEQAKAKAAAAKAVYQKTQSGPRPEEKDAAEQAARAAKARYDRMLKGPRQEEKDQAKSEWETALADQKQAREDLDRIGRLYQQRPGVISKAEYDAAVAAFDRARGRVRAAKAHLDLLQEYRPEDRAEALAEWKKAEAQFQLMKKNRQEEIDEALARWKEAKSRVEELQANLKELVITAPRRAVVEVIAVREGDLIGPNQPIVRVLYPEDLWVKAYVPEPEMGKVRLHQKVEVTIDTYPGKRFPGTIYYLSPISEFTPRNVQSLDERRHQVFAIKVRLDAMQEVFHSGMAAEVFIPVPEGP